MGCNCGGSQQTVVKRAPLRGPATPANPNPESQFGPLSADHYATVPTYWQGPETPEKPK